MTDSADLRMDVDAVGSTSWRARLLRSDESRAGDLRSSHLSQSSRFRGALKHSSTTRVADSPNA